MSYSISYIYRIKDRYSAVLDKMASAGKKFNAGADRIQSKLSSMQTKLQSTGAKMANLQTGLASLGTGMLLKDALKETVEFGNEIGRIGTLIPGQKERLESLKGTIGELAFSASSDMKDVAGGAFDVISAFGDMEGETEKRISAVTKASVAGGSSASEALSLLSAVTKSYGDTSGAALQKASDLAFMTNVLGQTTFPEMAASIGGVLPLAAKLGVTQEEVFAATAALTGVTGNTSEVMTQQAAIMSALIKPTADMRKAISAAGYESASAMIKAEGFSGSLEIIKKASKGSEEMVGKLFGRKEAMTAFFALSGAQAGKFSDALTAMGDAAASGGQVTQDALNEMMDTPGFKLNQMTVAFQNLKVGIGDVLADAIMPLVSKFAPLIMKFKESNPQMLKMITYALMAVTALGAIMIPLGLLISSMGTIIGVVKGVVIATKLWTGVQIAFNAVMSANPIALVVIGIAALIAITILVVKHWKAIVNALKSAWQWMVNLYDKIKPFIVILGGPMIVAVMAVVETIRSLVNSFADIKAAFKDKGFLAGMKELGLAIIKGMVEPFRAVWELITKIGGKLASFGGKVKDKFFPGKPEIDDPENNFYGAASPVLPSMESAPLPTTSAGKPANASASVSVYTEKGMGVVPFAASGDLGYNMQDSYTR